MFIYFKLQKKSYMYVNEKIEIYINVYKELFM